MFRKLITAGATLAVLSGVAVATPLGSYARCGIQHLTSSAHDAVPVEWELKRARQMISDLKPEIEDNARRIAREKIEVARLERELTQTDERLATARADIERLTEDLQRDSSTYAYGGKTYTSSQVKSDLSSRFKRFQTREETSRKLQQMLTARQASLQSATERMDAMLDARRQLEVEVENMQARLGALRLAQTSSELNLDDSALSRTRQLLDDIGTRIDVEEETMAVDVEYFGEINLETPSDENLIDDITAYFDARDNGSSRALVTTSK